MLQAELEAPEAILGVLVRLERQEIINPLASIPVMAWLGAEAGLAGPEPHSPAGLVVRRGRRVLQQPRRSLSPARSYLEPS